MLAVWLLLLSFCFLFPFISSQIDRDHQDHTAFGVEIDQNLRFHKRAKIIVKKSLIRE